MAVRVSARFPARIDDEVLAALIFVFIVLTATTLQPPIMASAQLRGWYPSGSEYGRAQCFRGFDELSVQGGERQFPAQREF